MSHDLFHSKSPSLKICGITQKSDALALSEMGIPALGINFWPPSKRYCSPENARTFLGDIVTSTARVGVFVNNAREIAPALLDDQLLDAVQLHGDESLDDIHYFLDLGTTVIRAIAATKDLPAELLNLKHPNFALLLDTPAGKDYGGTGKTFDWSIAAQLRQTHPHLPLLLAGGLNPANAPAALSEVNPTAIDIASGAELSPGIKDLNKAAQLLAQCKKAQL